MRKTLDRRLLTRGQTSQNSAPKQKSQTHRLRPAPSIFTNILRPLEVAVQPQSARNFLRDKPAISTAQLVRAAMPIGL